MFANTTQRHMLYLTSMVYLWENPHVNHTMRTSVVPAASYALGRGQARGAYCGGATKMWGPVVGFCKCSGSRQAHLRKQHTSHALQVRLPGRHSRYRPTEGKSRPATRHNKSMESPPQPAGEAQAPSPATSPIPDRSSPSPELPLTMTASAVLSSLPRDATSALAAAGQFPQEKILVRFKPVGAAPSLGREVCKISAAQKFEAVVAYLRRVLKVKDTDSVFLYVNSAFAPSLDEIVGNLHRVSPACVP